MASAIWLVPLLTSAVHAYYVVRVGGDFMHGRFFVPTWFALLLPIMLVRIPAIGGARFFYGGLAAALAIWAVLCGLTLRVPYAGEGIGPLGIADERSFYVNGAHMPNPVTLQDHAADPIANAGAQLASASRQQHRTFLAPDDAPPPLKNQQLPLPAGIDTAVNLVAARDLVGQSGYAAGTDVFLVDRFALAEPIGSLQEKGRCPASTRASPRWNRGYPACECWLITGSGRLGLRARAALTAWFVANT
jgi:arabinofuranosyltransferase